MNSPPRSATKRLVLDQVTLCAISSSNVAATVHALEATLEQIEVAQALLFTDANLTPANISISDQISVVPIERLTSSRAYSAFVLEMLADHVTTSHCMIVQWDGHVLDANRWIPEFLDYDYIGARWPQFDDGFSVGNGGFSLRSRALMEACRDAGFVAHHPEDIAICRTNRAMLESRGFNFAPAELADRFSAERAGDPAASFGYHGVFLMPDALGPERFWELYRSLDDRATLRRDILRIAGGVLRGKNGFSRAARLLADCFRGFSGDVRRL